MDRVTAELRAAGHDVRVIRRDAPSGYKAGALALGLASARGEFVAIFDADARPAPDLLRRLYAALDTDDRLAFVQARWSFDNERQGLLTRMQAMIGLEENAFVSPTTVAIFTVSVIAWGVTRTIT